MLKYRFRSMGVMGSLLLSGAGAAQPVQNFADLMVIEAEEMVLASSEIMEVDGASGGKAIKFLSRNSTATIELALAKGQYVANINLKADNYDGDGVYLAVGKKVKRTATAHHHNVWVYGTKFLTFQTDGGEPVKLEIAAACECHDMAEFGMLIDRLEVAPLVKSADILDYWTGLNYTR